MNLRLSRLVRSPDATPEAHRRSTSRGVACQRSSCGWVPRGCVHACGWGARVGVRMVQGRGFSIRMKVLQIPLAGGFLVNFLDVSESIKTNPAQRAVFDKTFVKSFLMRTSLLMTCISYKLNNSFIFHKANFEPFKNIPSSDDIESNTKMF